MTTGFRLSKMLTSFSAADGVVDYSLQIGSERLALNPLLGKKITLHYTGTIVCGNCGKPSKKSFNQGYCYSCFMKLASCDVCVVKPELCHYRRGTCREPNWALDHCLIPHVVYIANTSGIKVGITRAHQKLTRWMDQGAVQALALVEVKERYHSGLVEDVLREYVSDSTNWRKMLVSEREHVDLYALREELFSFLPEHVPMEILDHELEVKLRYPILRMGEKLTSMSFEKSKDITGVLTGIKGQYLIFEDRVVNLRSHAGYMLELEIG